MKWFKENWFKIVMVLLLGGFLATYIYSVYKSNQLTPKEKLKQELEERIFKTN